jgi:hypothetical protein
MQHDQAAAPHQSNLPSGIDLPEVSLSGLAHVYESIWGHL